MDNNEAVVAIMREAGHDAWTKSTSSWGPALWNEIMRGALAGLGANGYVVVPEPVLKELLSLSPTNHNEADRYHYARRALAAAVVEAVGPTREDTEP